MERSHGEEGVEGKCRKDKGHDLWYRPGPLAEFRQIPMCCLSYRSRQQLHLLQYGSKLLVLIRNAVSEQQLLSLIEAHDS